MKNRFEIDIIELCLLADTCIPPTSKERGAFFKKLTDVYYDKMNIHSRKRMFDWIVKRDYFDINDKECNVFYKKFVEYSKEPVSKKKPVNIFEVNIDELCLLAEHCIPFVPIARAMFFHNLTDVYHEQMTNNSRQRMFLWITKQDKFDRKDKDCDVFYHRYNKENQYTVSTDYEDNKMKHQCFKYEGKYWTSRTQNINEAYITKVEKIIIKN